MEVTVSRSYRKPWVKDHNKGMKAFANNVVKQAKDVPNGMAYKKFFDRYSICDFRWYEDKPYRLGDRIEGLHGRYGGEYERIPLRWNKWARK
jgi:hypothetical protein